MRFSIVPSAEPDIPLATPALPIIWALQALRPRTPQWAVDLVKSLMVCLLQDIKLASFDDMALWTNFDRSELETLLGGNTDETRAALVAIEAIVPGMLKHVGVGFYRAIQMDGGALRHEMLELARRGQDIARATGGKDGVGLEGAILDEHGYPIDTGHMDEALQTAEVPTVREPDPADPAHWTTLAAKLDGVPQA